VGASIISTPVSAKKRFKPTKRDLRDTLDAMLAGERLAKRTTEAVGCYIDFSNDKNKDK
jgi:hypothetical protein